MYLRVGRPYNGPKSTYYTVNRKLSCASAVYKCVLCVSVWAPFRCAWENGHVSCRTTFPVFRAVRPPIYATSFVLLYYTLAPYTQARTHVYNSCIRTTHVRKRVHKWTCMYMYIYMYECVERPWRYFLQLTSINLTTKHARFMRLFCKCMFVYTRPLTLHTRRGGGEVSLLAVVPDGCPRWKFIERLYTNIPYTRAAEDRCRGIRQMSDRPRHDCVYPAGQEASHKDTGCIRKFDQFCRHRSRYIMIAATSAELQIKTNNFHFNFNITP